MKTYKVEVETYDEPLSTYEVIVRARSHEEAERVAEDTLDIPYGSIERMVTTEVETAD